MDKKPNLPLLAQNTFASPDGQEFLKYLRKRFNSLDVVSLPVGNDGHVDALDMAFRNGQRSVVCLINRLMKESIHEEKQEYAENDKPQTTS